MRELTVRIRFTKHCLGNVRKLYWQNKKRRKLFLMPRATPSGRVQFMPTWWQAVLAKAAQVLCRHQDEVSKIRFSMEVDGSPRPVPEEFFQRFWAPERFSNHEAFFPGDVIGVNCIVPESISDEDFHRLMSLAGKYYGISPSHPNDYGFFEVDSILPCGPRRDENKQAADSREVSDVTAKTV